MVWKNKQFWGLVIAIALLAYCLKDVRFSDIRELSVRLSYYFFILSLISSSVFVILRGVRWRLMVAQQRNIRIMRAITLYSVGQILNVVMPALTGQIGRLFLFSKREHLKKTFVFSTMVLEVLFDAISLVGVLLLTSLVFVFPQGYQTVGIVITSIVALITVTLYLILHYRLQLENTAQRKLRDRRPRLYVGVRKFLRSFTKGIELLRSSHHLFGLTTISIISWAFHVLTVFFLFQAFGFPLSIASAAGVMIINTLALMIPITPGNAGTFEVAVSTTLLAFGGVSRSDTVLFAIALHILDLLPIFVLGYIFLHYEKLTIREIKKRAEEKRLLDEIPDSEILLRPGEKV
jgi:uncharacterized protein (TIRG00374 family)